MSEPPTMDRPCRPRCDRWLGERQNPVRRPWTTAFVLLLAVAVGCRGQKDFSPPARRNGAPTRDASDTAKYPAQWLGAKNLTVAPGVHVFGSLVPSTAYAVETDQGVILIDSGVDESGQAIRECMLAVGLSVERIRYLLITHAHYDHVFGANKLREMSPAIVCAGREDCEVLRAPDLDALFGLFPRQAYSGASIQIDRELQDGDAIELGGVKITVIAAPGHTAGSLCYLLEKDSQRILFSGDVIASLNFGPATYPVHISPRYRGDAESYLKTIERLLDLEPPDLLLPGHPLQQSSLQSIRMDEPKWRAVLEPARAELRQVLDRHQQDGKDFLDGAAKEVEPGLYYLGDLDGTAVYCLADDQQFIVINAPGGDRFATFLSTQLETLGLTPQEPTAILLTSSDESCRSGVASFATAPLVVAPERTLTSLRANGVENAVSHKELAGVVKLAIEAIPLDETLAYSFLLGSKQVLVTPKVPRRLTMVWTNRQNGRKTSTNLESQSRQLFEELAASPSAVSSYHNSLRQLADVSPDIWLPAMPLVGQNANLYDDQWQTVIEDNRRLVEKF